MDFDRALEPFRDAAAAVAAPQPDAPNAQLRIRGANLGADWRSAFMAWLRDHGYYPRQAAEAGEDGTAVEVFSWVNGRDLSDDTGPKLSLDELTDLALSMPDAIVED